MSYEIVRNVKVSSDGVATVKSASNNVYPRTPSEWTMSYRSEHNPFTGKLGAEVEIFAGYEQGDFQGGSNKFTRQLEVLRHLPEYAKFDWRGDWDGTKESREDKRAYYELLATALQTPAPKARFAIAKNSPYTLGQKVYGRYRRGGRAIYWTSDKSKATLYRFADDAENIKKSFYNSDNWEVEEV